MSTPYRGSPRRTVGLFADPVCGRLALAVLEARGHGLSGRVTLVGRAAYPLPDDLQADLTAALPDEPRPPAHFADVAARLAEFEAEAVHGLLRSIASAGANADPLLVAVSDVQVRHAAGRPWEAVLALGDAARLAELTGLNILDACEARHVAAGNDAAALDSVALWLVLHSLKRDRVYLECGRGLRLVVLPAGCEESAAARVCVRTIERQPASRSQPATWSDLAWQAVDVLRRLVPQSPNPIQLLVRAIAEDGAQLVEEILRLAPFAEPLAWHHVHIPPDALDAAVTAAMGLLFLDTLPQASDATDLTRGPRLLGRLTPGSIPNWHRLIDHAAANLPENVPLRAAI